MKTFNRKTASTDHAEATLAELDYRVRHLWSTNLSAPSEVRSHLMDQLRRLEFSLERLSIRFATDSANLDDRSDIEQHVEEVAALEQAWAASSQPETVAA